MNSYGRIFAALNEAGVQYIVVGGVAMNFLGYPRFTGDIDILMALDEPNLKNMTQLMKTMGYVQRVPVNIEELGDEKKVLMLIRDKNLIAFAFINDAEPQFNIDIIVGESLNFDHYREHQQILKVLGTAVPIVSIDDLIGMKKKSNRKQDAEDVAALLELKGL
ncbi:nucleotidyl transferase AbiEii/AbiGii toxin family protein [Candidatus Peregrinibacteria bacterium]|nr:nucleotidyl transferase AbiEii/AbiGii toxin family protein [Candidatus Peregrinibacteria bacterium]